MNKQKRQIMPLQIIYRVACLVLLTGLLPQKTKAEAKVDSLRQVWSNEAEADSNRYAAIYAYYLGYSYAYPDSILSLTSLHYDMAQKSANQEEMVKALNNRSLAYYLLAQTDSAMAYLLKALDVVSSLGDSANIGRQYANIGSVYRNQNNYIEAVRYYSLSLEILKRRQMKFEQAEILNNLGLVYYDIKRFELALGYLEEALALYQELDLDAQSGNIWLNIGSVNYEQGDHQQSIRYAKKALKILMPENHLVACADAYRLLAQTYQKLGKKDTAIAYLEKSLNIYEEMGNQAGIINNKILLANLIFEDDPKGATLIGEEVLDLGKGLTGNIWKRDLYQLLYRCYKASEQFTLSLEMNEKYNLYNDSVNIELNDIAVVREAIKGEFELELLQKQKENEEAQAQLVQEQRQERFTLLMIGFVLIVLVLIYARTRSLAYRKEQAALLDEIERLKNYGKSSVVMQSKGFRLDRIKVESAIDKPLNETDWKVLNLLLDDPVISNKEIANQAFMSIDGIGSSLRRMYSAFEIKESRYKKISLLIETIKISNS